MAIEEAKPGFSGAIRYFRVLLEDFHDESIIVIDWIPSNGYLRSLAARNSEIIGLNEGLIQNE